MANFHSASFRFTLNDLCPAHRVVYKKKIQKMDICLAIIEAHRFTLEQDVFDLIRLRYEDCTIIIRRLRYGSCDYEFYIRFYK